MENDRIMQDAASICERVPLDTLRNQTVLITGASGLVGTYFLACLAHLSKRGFGMKVIAQVLSEPPPHVSELVRSGGFEWLQTDLAKMDQLSKLPESDVVVHAAGYAQPTIFMANPANTLQINTSATMAILQRLRKGGRFLFVSSSEVYSGLKKTKLSEDDIGTTTPCHPRAAYIEGKRCGEAICSAFRAQGVHAASARLAHTYGPGTRKHDRRALNSFIEKAFSQKRIELLDSGKAYRTYCYIADAVELMLHILLRGKEPVYNVGGHSRVTISELARTVGRLTGTEVIFPSNSAEIAGAPEDVELDLTKAETEFRKMKYVGLEDGLQATIDWQRQLYS